MIKAQSVRLIDVFVLGPAMIAVGSKHGGVAGTFVAVSGLATILYNGANYLSERERPSIPGPKKSKAR